MLLKSLETMNYRSLEHVKLKGLERLNVLIGRNNSGKSAVFGVLQLLGSVLANEDTGNLHWDRVLSRLDSSRLLEVKLTFEPSVLEREQFVDLISRSAQQQDVRMRRIGSPLMRRVAFHFRSAQGAPNYLHLREMSLLAQDGEWATVQRMTGSAASDTPESKITRLERVGEAFPFEVLDARLLDVDEVNNATGGPSLAGEYSTQSIPFRARLSTDRAISWLREQLAQYFRNAFFFNPFRHSEEILPISEKVRLAQDGSDLVQVLHTLNNNNREKFEQIEKFVHGALPDIGKLQSTLVSNETRVDFRSPLGDFRTRLHEMGGGIEQLLMVAVVLLTTGDESSLFLEEPEGHLHAGAQRYLIEKFYEGERQIFVTTHAPTFVNLSRPKSLYRVTLSDGSTNISQVRQQGELGEVLIDIGARNSDVLLSDAVLFVEGPGDRDVFGVWANKLGTKLVERNVAVLPMSGGEHVSRAARARSDVLEGISSRASVPHLFVVDRDERGLKEIEKLQQQLGDKLHALEQRELENYLLVPHVILAALKSKHMNEAEILGRLEQASAEEVKSLIDHFADELHGLVLLKRIRSEIAGLAGGLMPRDIAEQLATRADDQRLHQAIRQALENRVASHISGLDLELIVREQKKALSEEWSEVGRRVQLAPGTEVLEKVFEHFGSKYNKPKDTTRLAKHMGVGDIPREIRDLLNRAAELSGTE